MADTPSPAPATDDPALLALRTQIDAVDRELLGLLNRRARLAQDVGEIKRREGAIVFRPE
ncbi:MAG: chorismate mutase, partial [Aquabacterium sp.]